MRKAMSYKIKVDDILQYCLENFDGTVLVSSWGEKGIFYNPNRALKRGVYILTVKIYTVLTMDRRLFVCLV